MSVFIDIHTHSRFNSGTSVIVRNLEPDFNQVASISFCTAGLHPWYLKPETSAGVFHALEKIAALPNVIAIGECGLDKVCNTDYALQQHWFLRQIELATSLNKPLIIHCVRAFDETLELLQSEQVTTPVIFHGFNKSIELATRIIAKGYYLSFGKVLQGNKKSSVLNTVPLNRVFLETDSSSCTIDSVYGFAAAALNIETELLSASISKNFETVFGFSPLPS